MSRTRIVMTAAAAVVASVLHPCPAAAQNARLELSVSPQVINFTLGDPDVMPVVSAPPITVSYRLRGLQGKATWQLTVLASGDLVSGPSTVDISNVTWVATPAPPFRSGTLNRTVAQVVAGGSGSENPTQVGSFTFRMNNSWTYDSGIYTQTIVFTLSTP
jgi:hypothetical protein